MKIIICEDDKLTRQYLDSLLKEIIKDECIIKTASNGLELIKLAKIFTADFALVDIQMPQLDGLSAISECIKFCLNTKFVVLTAHAKFDYAQKCFEYGVFDYLLKPIDEETLSKLIDKIKIEIEARYSLDNIQFEHNFISLYNTPNNTMVNDFNKKIDIATDYYFYEFPIMCKNYDIDFIQIYSDFSSALKKIIKNHSGNCQTALFYLKNENLALVIKADATYFNVINNEIKSLFSSMKANNGMNYLLFCIFCKESVIISLLEKINQLDNYLPFLLTKKPFEIYPYEQLEYSNEQLDFLSKVHQIIFYLLDQDEIKSEYVINYLKQNTCNTNNLNFIQLSDNLSKLFDSKMKDFNVNGLLFFFQNIVSCFDQNLLIKSTDKIDLIKSYIDENYMNDISVSSISQIFEITPNYLSKLFHEKTGVRFIDYLTKVRMYNAKVLLIKNPSLSIKSISEMVGYYSARHFTNLFYKYSGSYPSDLRKKDIN